MFYSGDKVLCTEGGESGLGVGTVKDVVFEPIKGIYALVVYDSMPENPISIPLERLIRAD